MPSTYKRQHWPFCLCIDFKSYLSDELHRNLYITDIIYALLLFHTIVKVIRMKPFRYTNCMILVVITYVDEPIVILYWRSWKLRSSCTIPLLFGSFIVGWTTSTKRNGGGPWVKRNCSVITSPLQSQPSL